MNEIIRNDKFDKKIIKLNKKIEKIKSNSQKEQEARLLFAQVKMFEMQKTENIKKRSFKNWIKFHFTKQHSLYTKSELIYQAEKTLVKLEKLSIEKQKLMDMNDLLISKRRIKGQAPTKSILNRNIKIMRLEAKLIRFRDNSKKINEGTFNKLNYIQTASAYFKTIPYKNQKMIYGILFTLPWFIGALIFFIWPLLTTIGYSFYDIKPLSGGGFTLTFKGITNYINAFTTYTVSSTIFVEALFNSTKDLVINLPVILIFSLLIAVILNTKFKGSTLVKAIFFIPVVFNIDIINLTLTREFGTKLQNAGQYFTALDSFKMFLMNMGIGNSLVGFLISSVDRIFNIINLSGVQILIFLAAIQSIPKNLYEAAKVEGATKYETFWKITFPMVTPIFLTALIYTIVDSFLRSPIMRFIEQARADVNYGLGSAVSVVYFMVSLLVVAVAFLIMKGVVFYYDEK